MASPMAGSNGAGSTGCRRVPMKRTLTLGKETKDVELIRLDGVTTLVW